MVQHYSQSVVAEIDTRNVHDITAKSTLPSRIIEFFPTEASRDFSKEEQPAGGHYCLYDVME